MMNVHRFVSMCSGDARPVTFDEVLIKSGLLEAELLAEWTERAWKRGRPVAQLLVDNRVIAEKALAALVARALGVGVTNLDSVDIDRDASRLLPSVVAEQHLVVPLRIHPESGTLEVAYANPFDDAALRAIDDIAEQGQRKIVATVSSVLRAIERAHGRADTSVMHASAGMRNDPTQQIADRSSSNRSPSNRPSSNPSPSNRSPSDRALRERPSTGEAACSARAPDTATALEAGGGDAESGIDSFAATTVPMHRIEHEATLEQRLDALLLAVIESGAISRADYTRALHRLLRRARDVDSNDA